jgi:hypothetical protein
VNWVWELETLPQRGRKVIVNLFKAGDTAAREQGITLVSICRKMFTNMLRKRMESQVHLHEAQAAFRSKDAQTTCSCSRILQEAGKANKTVYAFFLTCAKRMIRSGGMGYPSC